MKALGFRQESSFFWRNQHREWNNNHWLPYPVYAFNEDTETFATADDIHGVSAYSVAELGSMLPRFIDYMDERFWLCCSRHTLIGHTVMYENPITEVQLQAVILETEADARGKMLCYLAENGLIDPKNI